MKQSEESLAANAIWAGLAIYGLADLLARIIP